MELLHFYEALFHNQKTLTTFKCKTKFINLFKLSGFIMLQASRVSDHEKYKDSWALWHTPVVPTSWEGLLNPGIPEYLEHTVCFLSSGFGEWGETQSG